MEPKWLLWAKHIQAIAQTGLTYSTDVFDRERYEQLRKISVEIMAQYTSTDEERIYDLFANETGYQTPKVAVRGVVCRDHKMLLVKELSDGKWTLPGGWADIGLTPAEVAVKEIEEESGFETKPIRILAVLDSERHHPPSPYHVYIIFVQCEITGGDRKPGVETCEVGFYDEDSVPSELSEGRTTKSEIRMLFDKLRRSSFEAEFDKGNH